MTLSPEDLVQLAPAFLGRQRWFPGDEPEKVDVEDFEVLRDDWPKLVWSIVGTDDGCHYQMFVGGRPMGEPAEFLGGHERGVLGESGDGFWYDAAFDPALAMVILDIVTEGREKAERVRPMGVEQSNSSLVFDDQMICKLFRRLQSGRNPDVEITYALSEHGFAHVAAPIASWTRDGYDLAFVQRFLAGGSEGWALALTSLRDLYASGPDDPAEAGGDFADEATRLGRVSAEMHVAMAAAFGSGRGDQGAWAKSMEGSLARVASELEPEQRTAVQKVSRALSAVADPGAAVRVHGDYHLGQTMRTDDGWFVLDFEGEPARPLAERSAHTSPLKDVTGMLRSLDYATRSALADREQQEVKRLGLLGEAWRDRNRQAFLDGYRETPGVEQLLPADAASYGTVLTAFELEKALYELAYELAYRPDWAEIPRAAIRDLIA